MAQIPIFDENADDLKRYYSIGEVADMFEISKSQIRYWEGEFDILKPHKNSRGERRFTKENIEQLKKILYLLRERGFTLDGAKKEIARQKGADKEKLQLIERLTNLKGFLEELKNRVV